MLPLNFIYLNLDLLIMLLRTHYIFSTGLLTLVNSILIHNFYINLIISGTISVAANSLIDRFGHEIKGPYIARSPKTHTVPRSILWGLIPSIFVIFLLEQVTNHILGEYTKLIPLLFVDGVIVGPSHMLLDVFTERGIYIKKNGKWKRFALAHYRYNDPVINGISFLAGVIMLYFAFAK